MLHLDLHIFFFFFFIPVTWSLSFNISSISFSDSSQFNLTGDASISDQGIQVTPNEPDPSSSRGKAGRAVYSQPLHLWDEPSRNLTDFYTHFTILIDANGSLEPRYGDGLTFFLAPLGSRIQSGSYGGGLGLGGGSTPVSSSSPDSFVALEFDTYLNSGVDPSYVPHVGIDVNSMKSVTTVKWDNNISYGVTNDVWISYTASSRILKADFTGNSSNGTQRGSLSYEVDLRDYLPEYVAVGFSAATGIYFEIHNVKSWDFSSTLPSYPTPKKKKNKVLEVLKFLGALLVVLLIPLWCLRKNKMVIRAGNDCGALFRVMGKVLLWVWNILMALLSATGKALWWLWNKCMSSVTGNSSKDEEFIEGSGPRKISYNKIVRATNNFKEKLGQGASGKVYKGILSDKNEHIAVKRVSKKSKQGEKEYSSEVKIISQLKHGNLVQLIGWCHQRRELLLVYELMANGSLDSHLFGEKKTLSWEIRYKIAHGVAKGLMYLHEDLKKQYVLHRDIKSSNIMLDSEFVAKLGDFGVARFVDHDKDLKTTTAMGTHGYFAPEVYMNCGKASKASDIYSFGIVLLEIACGRASLDEFDHESLVLKVRRLYEAGQVLEAADTKLGPLSRSDAPKVQQLLLVGLKCANHEPHDRPAIGDVVQDLSYIIS